LVELAGSSIWTSFAFVRGVTVLAMHALFIVRWSTSTWWGVGLAGAARSLGAGWASVLWRVILRKACGASSPPRFHHTSGGRAR
jgi:hypothetical protein